MRFELRPTCERRDAMTSVPDCAETLAHVCPSRDGELVRRPRRAVAQ